jgi:hypothetical protein
LLEEYTKLIFDLINKHSFVQPIVSTNIFIFYSVMPVTAHPAFNKVDMIFIDDWIFYMNISFRLVIILKSN